MTDIKFGYYVIVLPFSRLIMTMAKSTYILLCQLIALLQLVIKECCLHVQSKLICYAV